jgi:PAS domain S-box-containing protein
LLGFVALAALTALCFWLDFRVVSAAFAYLILIVLLSLRVTIIPLAILSLIAVGALNYFFVTPIFSFRIEYQEDIITLAAFFIASLIVSGLVTRRKRVEQALQWSEAYLADAQRISHTGSFAYDVASRRLLHSSEEHHRLFGFDPSAGMPSLNDWIQRIHPDDREMATRTMEETLRERRDYEVDFRIVHPDGTIKHIHSVSHGVLSPSGDLVEIAGTSTDVTERRQAEYLIGQVFERSPDLVAILGRDYRYRRANPTFEKWRGIAPEKLIGMHIRDVVGKDMYDRLAKPHLDRCFAGEEASFADWFEAHGGRKYWFVTYSPLRLESERIEAALIIGRDLTEYMLASERLRDARIQLAHANRVATVGQLTASIAHEVNQPIGALVTNAHAALRLLSASPPDLDQTRDALGDIIKDGRRVSEVIDRIRALVKKEPPRANQVDVNEAIVDSIALTRAEILKGGISLETQLMKDLPPILGDRVQFQQVVMNLLMNAIEAMSAVGEGTRGLQIVTGQEGDQIFITVRDSGPELKAEDVERFFEAFYSTKSHGMGIGLSICRSIIEAHRGRIWATANAPRGATFHITLPASRPNASH